MLEGILVGIPVGWFTLMFVVVVAGRRVAKNPPEALIKALSKMMARQFAKSVTRSVKNG